MLNLCSSNKKDAAPILNVIARWYKKVQGIPKYNCNLKKIEQKRHIIFESPEHNIFELTTRYPVCMCVQNMLLLRKMTHINTLCFDYNICM